MRIELLLQKGDLPHLGAVPAGSLLDFNDLSRVSAAGGVKALVEVAELRSSPAFVAAPRTEPEATHFYIPSLDGIRAVAFLIVFAAHAGLARVPAAFGVTAFFFLSGYLIATLMRREVERTGMIDLRSFYLRRVLRILPPSTSSCSPPRWRPPRFGPGSCTSGRFWLRSSRWPTTTGSSSGMKGSGSGWE